MTKAGWVKYIFRVSRKKTSGAGHLGSQGYCRHVISATGLTGGHFHFETGSSRVAQASLELMSLSSRSSGVLGSQAFPQPLLHTTYCIHFTRVWRSTGVAGLPTALATHYSTLHTLHQSFCSAVCETQQMFLCPLMTSRGILVRSSTYGPHGSLPSPVHRQGPEVLDPSWPPSFSVTQLTGAGLT